jgi:hypothetical protein
VITIGLRASPSMVTFAVYDTTNHRVLNIEEIRIPAAFSVPESLKYVRSNILDVLREYKVENAGIRITEPNAQSTNISRLQIEGVIQEAFASSCVAKYYVGQIASICAKISIARNKFKIFVEGTEDYGVEKWASLTKEQREALLCAIGAKNA